MNIVVGFSCLVAVAVTAGITGLPEQQLEIEDQIADFDEDHLERQSSDGKSLTKRSCKIAGGRCQPLTEECDGALREGSYYCKYSKDNGCCIPPGCVYDEKAYPHGSSLEIGCLRMNCKKGIWSTDSFCNDKCDVASEVWSCTQPCSCQRILNKGCVLRDHNIPQLSCRCILHGLVTSFESNCTGTVEPCADWQSPDCQNPGRNYGNCMQGSGNCCGYEVANSPACLN